MIIYKTEFFLEENQRKRNLEDNQVDSGSERNHQTDNLVSTRNGELEYCHQQDADRTRDYENNSINKRNQEEIKRRQLGNQKRHRYESRERNNI